MQPRHRYAGLAWHGLATSNAADRTNIVQLN